MKLFGKILMGGIVASAVAGITTTAICRNGKKLKKSFGNKESNKESK